MKCESCRSPDADLRCENCDKALCEDCVLELEHDAFFYMPKKLEVLSHKQYCRFCMDDVVEPELQKYNELLDKAKETFVFFTTQKKEIPLIRKTKEKLSVVECVDRDETILRLAFMAAERGMNAVIEVEVSAQKIRNHAHHKHLWQGTGVPAMVDEAKISHQDRQNMKYERA